MTLYVLPAFAILLSAVILIRLREHYLSTAELMERSHPELLRDLLPYARQGDYDRLIQVVGGIKGVVCLHQSCGACASLTNRLSREDGQKAGPLAEQAMIYSIVGRLLTLPAIGDCLIRRALPAWPPVFLTAMAQIYCDMACTLEAMNIHA